MTGKIKIAQINTEESEGLKCELPEEKTDKQQAFTEKQQEVSEDLLTNNKHLLVAERENENITDQKNNLYDEDREVTCTTTSSVSHSVPGPQPSPTINQVSALTHRRSGDLTPPSLPTSSLPVAELRERSQSLSSLVCHTVGPPDRKPSLELGYSGLAHSTFPSTFPSTLVHRRGLEGRSVGDLASMTSHCSDQTFNSGGGLGPSLSHPTLSSYTHCTSLSSSSSSSSSSSASSGSYSFVSYHTPLEQSPVPESGVSLLTHQVRQQSRREESPSTLSHISHSPSPDTMATLISHQVTHTEAGVATEVSDKVTDSEAGLSTEVFHQSTKPTDIVTETVTGSTEVSEKVTEREVKLSTEVTHPETESTEFSEKVTETNAGVSTEVSEKVTETEVGVSTEVSHQVTDSTEVSNRVTETEVGVLTEVFNQVTESAEVSEKVTETEAGESTEVSHQAIESTEVSNEVTKADDGVFTEVSEKVTKADAGVSTEVPEEVTEIEAGVSTEVSDKVRDVEAVGVSAEGSQIVNICETELSEGRESQGGEALLTQTEQSEQTEETRVENIEIMQPQSQQLDREGEREGTRQDNTGPEGERGEGGGEDCEIREMTGTVDFTGDIVSAGDRLVTDQGPSCQVTQNSLEMFASPRQNKTITRSTSLSTQPRTKGKKIRKTPSSTSLKSDGDSESGRASSLDGSVSSAVSSVISSPAPGRKPRPKVLRNFQLSTFTGKSEEQRQKYLPPPRIRKSSSEDSNYKPTAPKRKGRRKSDESENFSQNKERRPSQSSLGSAPTRTFQFKFVGSKSSVQVVGSFNSWTPEDLYDDNNSGVWSKYVHLPDGTYSFRLHYNSKRPRYNRITKCCYQISRGRNLAA